ncbi:phage antirepressor N-terminal domain-containing protein [Halomonas pacifica]|uniref:phage antirepressor N-terminal domain-containing protein n=1 Tax=Bisbaumannia pacifica TaxID=77098 RepID=UPI0023585B09|nr:phage antirepressor N-terminal domain-containing protein [Halomonas pacifica]MDC8803947.1 phage antirepressor N-terminal domain-containing protein [Halomonas pacifica]
MNTSTDITTVPFHGHSLFLVEHEGQPYTPMKAIVEGMGLKWQPQHRKLNESRFKPCITEMVMQLPGDDQRRSVTCFPLRKLPGWLMTISPNKIKDASVRERVIQYQNECDDALWAYWSDGIAINPRITLTPAHQRGIQKAVARRCQALPEPARRSAYSRIYSHLKDRFEVGSYKDIDDSRYTEALGAVQSFELDGEWIDGKAPVEALIIDAPRAKHWAEYTVGELIGESTAHGQISQALNTLRRAARSGVHVNVRDMEAIDHEVAALRHIAEQALNRVDAITANLDCVQRHADIAERTWTGSIGPAVAMFDQVLAANMREHLGVLSRLLRYEIQRPRLAFAS